MKCNNCGYENPSEGTVDGRCDQCGTHGLTILGLPPEDAPVFETAGLGQRWLAQMLDSFIALGLIFIPTAAVAILTNIIVGTIRENDWFISLTLFIAFTLGAMYLLFADGLGKGQSYGKRMVGIAVVNRRTLEYCTFGQSFFRNISLVFLGWLDWIFIVGKDRQRLGDMVARTIVIKQPRR
jgi:uncharacterized RDD family membrane protein YckC